jgi:hypothetical protein
VHCVFSNVAFVLEFGGEGTKRCNVCDPPLDWEAVVSLGEQEWKGKSLRADI